MTARPDAARPPLPWWLSWPGLLLAFSLALAWRGAGGDLRELLGPGARASFADFARGFWPPAHDPALLASLLRPLGETIAIALLGMGLALAVGVPLAFLATSPTVLAACGARVGLRARALHGAARLTLAGMRSVPELVWALLFVRAIGLGPLAGVLAIGVAYGGVVGKVFADTLEGVPRRAAEALGTAGARPAMAFLLGIVPAARPLLVSYTLYRLDCALRASAVLGLVGAGGIGQQIELSLKMLQYDEVATYVIVLFFVVAAVDALSQAIRRAVERRGSLAPSSAAALRGSGVRVGALLLLLAGSSWLLDLHPGALVSPRALRGMAQFARTLWPPDLHGPVLRGTLVALGETLAISVLGTAIAAVAGLALAFAAARPLERASGERPAPAVRRAGALVAIAARALMNLARTLPELLWALLLVRAIGLGPFAGALALGVHTAGVLGRLYYEALEEIPLAPVAALRGAGASRTGAILHGLVPQVFPQLVTYTLYRWEVNIRASAVLGVVGAGGLGRDLKLALSWFDGPRVATLLLAILAVVAAVDLASAWVRRRVLAGSARRTGGAPAEEDERALAA